MNAPITTDLSSMARVESTFLWGLRAPALELCGLYGACLLFSYLLYQRWAYLFSLLLVVLVIPVGIPFVRAQLYIDAANKKSQNLVPIGADPLSFHVLIQPGTNGVTARYNEDTRNVYCDGKALPNADPKTFTILSGPSMNFDWAKDIHKVYNFCDPVPGADPQTISLIGDGFYAKDAASVYCKGASLPGSDPATFIIDSEFWSRDKNHVYIMCSVLPGADPKTYTVLLGGDYAKDKTSVFYISPMQGVAVAGADPSTFEAEVWRLPKGPPLCGTNCAYDAKDKNHFYWRGQLAFPGNY